MTQRLHFAAEGLPPVAATADTALLQLLPVLLSSWVQAAERGMPDARRYLPKPAVSEFGSGGLEAIWEFPKIRGTLLWGPYNKDPTIWGAILGSPIFGTPPYISRSLQQLWGQATASRAKQHCPWPTVHPENLIPLN